MWLEIKSGLAYKSAQQPLNDIIWVFLPQVCVLSFGSLIAFKITCLRVDSFLNYRSKLSKGLFKRK